MSSTRHSSSSGPFRQERFASSAAFSKGLLGNLVAKRAATLRDARERELIYFLHELSLRDGYALHYTCNLFDAWPHGVETQENERAFERVASWLVQNMGVSGKQISPQKIERIRRALPEFIAKLCLDPDLDLRTCTPPGLPNAIELLYEYKRLFEMPSRWVASTAVTRTIHELLDYALTQRGIVLVEGTYRVGKSMAAQSWAQMNLGRCRYVQLSSSNDETSFIRCFARALGVACSPQMKATQMRNRVEEVLRRQHLLIIVDEADYCLDGAVKVREAPRRINWLMTALINVGVPVALIASRNFSRMLAHLERRCPLWGSEQFVGRIKLRRTLPDNLQEGDLLNLAAVLLPEADEPTRMLLVGHAMRSDGYVAALESAASRARFFAEQAGRTVSFEDVECVMMEAGTDRPKEDRAEPSVALQNLLSPGGREAAATPARMLSGSPAYDRQLLGSLAGSDDFTGTRHPG